jgi:hypothetical protein
MGKQKFQLPELQKFNEQLRERAEYFLGMYQQESSRTLRDRHAIGKEAHAMTVKNQQKQAGMNGDRETYFYGVQDPLERIGTLLDGNRAYLTDAARFFVAINATQLDIMCAPSPVTGRAMGWGHIREILSLVNAEDRDKLIRTAHDKGWTILQLQEAIRKSIPAGEATRHTREGAGRKPCPPANAPGYFKVIDTFAGGLLERIPVITSPEHSLVSMVQAEAPDLTVPELESLIADAEARRDTVNNTVNELHKVRTDLSQSISVLSRQLEYLQKPASVVAERATAFAEAVS